MRGWRENRKARNARMAVPALIGVVVLGGCMGGLPLTPMEQAQQEHERRMAIAKSCLKQRRDSFCVGGPSYCREHIVEHKGVFYVCR